MNKLPLTSKDLLSEKIARIREEFPEVISEGKIDFDRLKMALGDFVDSGRERYGLSWAGKSEAIRNIQTPSVGTLLPVLEESVSFETSENLIIEGDNLEVLKLLQKSYHGKIKMIYIDPPYNTGNEFIYPDNFREGLDDYLQYSGQVDGDGIKLSTNTETDGRFHSKWLNMMYPRLFLAKNLLRDDGVVFVSIDDNEVHNLRAMMNEVFGEENFIANIVWQKKYSPQNDATYFSDMHDHILVYARQAKQNKNDAVGWNRNLLPRTEEQNARYKNMDNDPRGPWKSSDLSVKTYSAAYDYPITTPSGRVVNPPTGYSWRVSKERFGQMVQENRIWFGTDGNNVPSIKRFLTDVQDGNVPVTWWKREDCGDNQEAKQELKALLPEADVVFDTPKPVRLIRRMLQIGTFPDEEAIVLDFFAGSGTTAQAVLEQNHEDGGNRRFILVQLPEVTKSLEIPTIVDITKERVKKALEKTCETHEQNVGYRFFRLSSSNFKTWESSQASGKPDDLARQLRLFVDNIRPGRSQQHLLYEIMLKAGLPITVPITCLQVGEQSVFSIGEGALLICLDAEILENTLMNIVGLYPRSFVCLDTAFHRNDNLKTNIKLLMESHGIEFHTV